MLGCGVAAAFIVPGPALGAEKIQPGAQLMIPPGFICTANFIYDGIGVKAGHTYVGVASHCPAGDAELGAMISTNDGLAIGPLVLKNWPLKSVADDYALIEVLPERLDDVDASVAGHPGWPTGVATAQDVQPGDLAGISGWGLGVDAHQLTRENRLGVITQYTDKYYDIVGPISFGDSGGGLIHHESGKALGIVSAYCDDSNAAPDHPLGSPCLVYGPTIGEAMRRAAQQGFPIEMRLAG